MSEPTPTTIERAVERMIRAVTQLARTLESSDSRHADGVAAILARVEEMRDGLTAVLSALRMPRQRNGHGVWADGDQVTASFPKSALVGAARWLKPIAVATVAAAGGWLLRHMGVVP